MKKFTKKSIKNWEDILFIILLTAVFLCAILIAGMQDNYLFKIFLNCMAISSIGLSIITFVAMLKTFKVDNRLSNGKWKVNTLMFWIDVISMLSIVSSYWLIAFGILLINIQPVNICVICLGIHILCIITKIVLFAIQNKISVRYS